jgi:hypothetical protein
MNHILKILSNWRALWACAVAVLILSPGLLHARALNEWAVKNAVQTWVRHVTADARPGAVVETMEPYVVDGKVVAYIAHLAGGGFCLCGANDLVLPAYFYSPEGTYDPENPNYQYILWEIGARLDYTQMQVAEESAALHTIQDALSDRAMVWQSLIEGRVPEPSDMQATVQAAPNTMSTNLTAHWNQNSPYNDECPELTPGADEHVWVGCVATAMVQIMHYWKWPSTGVSSASKDYNYRWRSNWDEVSLSTNPNPGMGATYWSWENGRLEWTAGSGGWLRMTGYWDHSLYLAARKINDSDSAYLTALQTLWDRLPAAATPNFANFGATTYYWGLMPDTATDPPDTGALEVAKLSYHGGIAVQMNWGVKVSTSGNHAAVSALKNYFRYDLDAVDGGLATSTMIDEIQWLRPFMLGGCRDASVGGGCHSWVVYGYNLGIYPDHQFLINMGWGGSSDGWYTLDSMPFNLSQSHSVQIAPLNVKFVGAIDPGDGSPNDAYEDIEEALVEAADGSTLIFKTGSTNTFSGASLVINRPLTLKGYNVTIQ